MFNQLVLIGIGGFLGAVCRFTLINELKKRILMSFPVPTMLVNIIGSFLLGLLVGLDLHKSVYVFAAIGFLGAFTTFSTFAVESVTLFQEKQKRCFLVYISGTFIGGILFCIAGWEIGLSV